MMPSKEAMKSAIRLIKVARKHKLIVKEPITKEPKQGWHWRFCSLCGKKLGRIIHLGGKKKLKKCLYCQEGFSVCMKCFEWRTNG